MKRYMTRLNNIKKYILPFLFLVMTFVMIPKEAYYKKGTIDVVATTTEGKWEGYLYLVYPKGYRMEEPYINISGEKILKKNLKNTRLDKYIFYINSPVGEFSELKFVSKKKSITIPKEVGQKYFEINWSDIRKIYTINFVNVILYFMTVSFLVYYYFKKGIEISLKTVGVFSLGLILMSIALNLKWLSKVNGIFLSLTLLKIYIDRKKIKFGYLEIVGFALLTLSLLSEYFNFFNYEKTYIYFQNTILILIAMKIWKFDYDDKKILKKYFKISLILLSLINLISPFIFGGGYSFTFGALMAILIADCVEKVLFKHKESHNLIVNLFSLLVAFYGLMISGRRTMIVAIGLYCLYLSIKLLKKTSRNTYGILIVAVIVISIIMGKVLKNEKNKIKDLIVSITNVKTDQSNIQRLLMWRRGYYIGKENPILGIGMDSFYKETIKEKYNSIRDEREQFEPIYIHVHNEYIHQIISRGFPGAILFYGIWCYILSRLRKSKDKDFDIMLLIIYGVYGIFDPYSIRAESIVFYTFIGISFVNCLPMKKKESKALEKLGLILTVAIFLIGLYFNKRFRYYFLIILFIYIGYYFYNRRKRVNYEKI